MANSFPKLMTGTKTSIQEAQNVPRKINTKKSTHRPILFKLQKTKNMEEILKVAKLGKRKAYLWWNKDKKYILLNFHQQKPGSKSGITYLVLKGKKFTNL